MKTQISLKGCESTADLEARVQAINARVREVIPDARFTKFSLETTATAYAVGLVVSPDKADSIVRHGSGPDWDRAFKELERRLDHLAESN